jgi:hypothetical protein
MKHEMSEAERAEALIAGLRVAAQRARLIDLDWLQTLDTGKITLREGPYGVTVEGADELMSQLKQSKPHLFQKHMKDMSPSEQAAWWAEHKKKFRDGSPPPKPLDMSKTAKEMSPREREAFLKECARRE